MPLQNNVRPDLIADDINIILFEKGICSLELLPLPDAPAGIMGRAENRRVNIPTADLLLHILIIHTPDPVLIPHKRTVDDLIAIVPESTCKTDISRCVHKHLVAARTEDIESTDQPPKHPVLISDTFGSKPSDPVPGLLPSNNRIKIFPSGTEITKGRMRDPLINRPGNCRTDRKIHIRHPHRNHIKTIFRTLRRKTAHISDGIYRHGIMPPTIHNGCKIIFHNNNKTAFPVIYYLFARFPQIPSGTFFRGLKDYNIELMSTRNHSYENTSRQ